MTARRNFLDLDFDPLTPEQAEAWLAARGQASPFAYIVTPNVDHMVRLASQPQAIRAAYDDADLCLCDSRVLARLAKLADVALTVVPGSDLVAALFDRVLKPGDRVCLIGGGPDHVTRLGERYPGIVVLHHMPPMGLRTNPAARAAAVDFAARSDARAILLAVGSPQQELLAHEMKADGRVRGTALCIGAGIDFIVGAQVRAPHIVQKAGFEWAWRLASQPRRLAKRYLVDGPAIFPLVWRWKRSRGR
ncbi:WecB/TagA/CpsF family glycosyltransferase [Sphingomonas quercus]|uniref:WecB/TagA/CpsF family glycosyltransferase n=1 Tax=Sphingomonas quercus TaxID=2842451 RepID=A0ABS6BHB1_9SPHN|nr:WecB/TagA/CpsF family glycosyltransferase [Sphingomonas quercus]MBU3077187.1 WecB/TagA/CpsF family glycosyltransferase [Sphingomonas quercus]